MRRRLRAFAGHRCGGFAAVLTAALTAGACAGPTPSPQDTQPKAEAATPTPQQAATPSETGARLTLQPTRGAPGETVMLTARGLPPQTRYHIGAGPPASEYEIFDEAQSDPDGTLVTRVTVPAWAEPGRTLIFAVSKPHSPFDVLSEPFRVVRPPAP